MVPWKHLTEYAALSDAMYWKLLLLSNLTMFYVFQKTTCPSLQFSMALQLIQKYMVHSMLIHKSGWCSKTHLGVQMVSQSNSSLTYLLTTFKRSTSLIISVSSSKSASSGQAASSSQSSSTMHPLIIAKCFVLNVHKHQLEEHLVHLLLHSCLVYFLIHYLRPEAPNYTNW